MDIPCCCTKQSTCLGNTAAIFAIISIDTPGIPPAVVDDVLSVFEGGPFRAEAKQPVRWKHGTHHVRWRRYGLEIGIFSDGIAADVG